MRLLSKTMAVALVAGVGMFAASDAGAVPVWTSQLVGSFSAPGVNPNCVGGSACTGVAGYSFTDAMPQWNPASYPVGSVLLGYEVYVTATISGHDNVTNNISTPFQVDTSLSNVQGLVNVTPTTIVPSGLSQNLSQTFLAAGYANPTNIPANSNIDFGNPPNPALSTTGNVNTGLLATNLGLVTGASTFPISGVTAGTFVFYGYGGAQGNLTSVTQVNAAETFEVAYLYDDNTHPSPEPASMALLASGIVGLGALRRRARR
jgi:hypothetical protein